MCVVSINVPEEILLDLHEDMNDFAEYMKKMLAVDLYKNKKVSLGYCDSVAEMSKEEFIKYLRRNFWRRWRMRKVVVNTTPLIFQQI